jgi:hypothetical protein
MARAIAVVVLFALLAGCGVGERRVRSGSEPARAEANEPHEPGALPPEIADLLLQGPGGSAAEREIAFEIGDDSPVPLRITFESPAP